MFATIIPALRTPRHVNAFDYAVPNGMDVCVGDLVKIPFRKGTAVGIVYALNNAESEIKNLKEIQGSYGGLRLDADTLSLLASLAARSFSSRASVLHAWLGNLPKREQRTGRETRNTEHANTPTASFLLPGHVQALIDRATELILSKRKLLILTPWASRADRIAEALRTEALTSDKAAGKRYKLWSSFVRDESPVLVATRLGAWLATEADTIILDEPENDDHKQDELSPRYDARWIAEAAQCYGRSVIKMGLTPLLNTLTSLQVNDFTSLQVNELTSEQALQPDNPPIRQSANTPDISPTFLPIDIHRSDWSPIAGMQNRSVLHLEQANRDGRPAFIIHPIHGDRARLRCKDCSWQAACSRCGSGLTVKGGKLMCLRCRNEEAMGLACPVCGGTDLSRSRGGRDRLEADLKERNLEARVCSIGEWNALNDLPEQSLVILTDLSLFSGGVEDLRKKERLIVAFRRLADACASAHAELVIQSDPELLTEAKRWLSGRGCEDALRAELKERELFRLPPAYRLLKLIIRGNEGHANRQLGLLKDRMAPNAPFLITGPFPVLHRPSHRTPRWIGHISAPYGAKTEEFERLIEPLLASDTLFDLDPIAFFE